MEQCETRNNKMSNRDGASQNRLIHNVRNKLSDETISGQMASQTALPRANIASNFKPRTLVIRPWAPAARRYLALLLLAQQVQDLDRLLEGEVLVDAREGFFEGSLQRRGVLR